MRSFYFLLAMLALAGLPVSLWVGATMVVNHNVPFIAFVLPVFADLAIACWAMHKLEE